MIPWVGSATFNMYCMSYEKDCLGPALRKFYLKASATGVND